MNDVWVNHKNGIHSSLQNHLRMLDTELPKKVSKMHTLPQQLPRQA
jgi:hypothetical protein